MEKLLFERRKYGKELLIDACNEAELDIVSDTLVLSFYTIIFLEESSGVYHLDTEEVNLKDNMVIFVRPGQVNKVDKAEFTKCHLLFFEGDFLDEFFNDKNFIYKFGYFHNPEMPSFIELDPPVFQKYYQLAREVREEAQNLMPDSAHILRSIVYYLLVRLNQEYAGNYGGSSQTLMEPKALAFLKLLERSVKAHKNVEWYARQLGISRVHLNKLSQKHFSKTANQAIREHLIAEAKKEIKYSGKGFSEIAYDLNFSAPSHFSRFVRQMTGSSPQEFRESLSNW